MTAESNERGMITRRKMAFQQRSHYVGTNGGDQPNVVPSNATSSTVTRRRRRG
jgi:metal-dependent amidase/aminoacylase/carboxypeptidase family protein